MGLGWIPGEGRKPWKILKNKCFWGDRWFRFRRSMTKYIGILLAFPFIWPKTELWHLSINLRVVRMGEKVVFMEFAKPDHSLWISRSLHLAAARRLVHKYPRHLSPQAGNAVPGHHHFLLYKQPPNVYYCTIHRVVVDLVFLLKHEKFIVQWNSIEATFTIILPQDSLQCFLEFSRIASPPYSADIWNISARGCDIPRKKTSLRIIGKSIKIHADVLKSILAL